MLQKEINSRYYKNKKKKEIGYCSCGKLLDREGYYCTECVNKHNEYERKTREFCREHGICPECRKNKLFGDEKICPECRAKAQIRRENYTEEQKQKYMYKYYDANKKRQRNKYKECAEKGICTRCKKRKAVQGKKKCAICQNKENEYKRKKNGNGIRRSERPSYNECYLCGAKLDREGSLCKKCAEKQKANLPDTSDNKSWRQDNKIVFKN